jgi:fatty-acyl-CoA synthase
VALLNPELSREGLTQALQAARARALLVEGRLAALAPSNATLSTWVYDSPDFAAALALAGSAPAATALPSGEQDFVYVYTSGTTGPSKPARVSHRRSLLAATSFAQLVHRLQSKDVLYCALPLHHASALLLGLGACLQAGATLALRERFSASALLDDVRRFEATVLLYIGELGRALLRTAPDPRDREHRLRLAVGNGLSADVWPALQKRFGIPQICEFYAATDFPGAIVNITGTIGSVGHIVLARARGYRLLRVDSVTGALVRGPSGRAIECAAGEAGELVLRLRASPHGATGVYAGYVEEQHTASRLVQDVFDAGDLYCRSGDLLRRDAAGHYWFVDRLGDSFRFKGENVASCEVEAAFAGLSGVAHVAVVGVSVPGVDGRPGLLVLASEAEPVLDELTARARTLPHYARPCFVRVVPALELTASLKLKKRLLALDGVDPGQVSGPLYFWDGQRYAALGPLAFSGIMQGKLRL